MNERTQVEHTENTKVHRTLRPEQELDALVREKFPADTISESYFKALAVAVGVELNDAAVFSPEHNQNTEDLLDRIEAIELKILEWEEQR